MAISTIAMERRPLHSAFPALHRFGTSPTRSDYCLDKDGLLVIYPDPLHAEPFSNRNYPKFGISLLEPEQSDTLHGSPFRMPKDVELNCSILVPQNLPKGWRVVFTHKMNLFMNDGSVMKAKHYNLYSSVPKSIDEYIEEPTAFEYIPCTLTGGGRTLVLKDEFPSSKDQPGIKLVYVLQMLRLLWDNNTTSPMDCVLICDIYNLVAESKKPLVYYSTMHLVQLQSILAAYDFDKEVSMLERQSQVLYTIEKILRAVSNVPFMIPSIKHLIVVFSRSF